MSSRLDKSTEEKLIALGNKRYYRTLALTIAWIVFVPTALVITLITTNRSVADPRYYIPLILLVLPFFPFSAHKVLLSKTFYATVSYNVHETQFESLKWTNPRNRPERVDVLEITFKKDDGGEITIAYKKDRFPLKGFHFEDGDRMFFARGLKYPLEFPIMRKDKITCPICGTTIEAERPVCRGCNLDLTEISEQNQ